MPQFIYWWRYQSIRSSFPVIPAVRSFWLFSGHSSPANIRNLKKRSARLESIGDTENPYCTEGTKSPAIRLQLMWLDVSRQRSLLRSQQSTTVLMCSWIRSALWSSRPRRQWGAMTSLRWNEGWVGFGTLPTRRYGIAASWGVSAWSRFPCQWHKQCWGSVTFWCGSGIRTSD
jgi:hypothetical protein